MNFIKQLFSSTITPNSLSYLKFGNNSWKHNQCHTDGNTNQKQLTFLTYNVWFEKHNFQERVVEILAIIKQFSCDFVCLQEVTPDFLTFLFNDPYVQQTYCITGNQIKGYGILILSKIIPNNIGELQFHSQFGRTFLYIVCKINNQNLVIGTSHLESMMYNEQLRADQLKTVYDALNLEKNVIIMGDFNLETPKDELSISPQYNDIWNVLHPNDIGYTFVIEDFKRRFDRVLLKKDGSYKPIYIDIVATQEIPLYKNKQAKRGEVKTPSDHYALKIEIQQIQ